MQNDFAQVRVLTSNNIDTDKWSYSNIAAASAKATDVAEYCKRTTPSWHRTINNILYLVPHHESLEPAYCFLVEENLANIRYEIDRCGSVLDMAAGERKGGRYSLVEYLLKKGEIPDQEVLMYASNAPLTTAASNGDEKMGSLLVN